MPQLILQFVSASDPLSRLIQYFSHGKFSHVDIVLESGTTAEILAGARLIGGVARRKPGYASWARQLRVSIPVSPVSQSAANSWLNQQVGKRYDWTAIAAFMFGRNWRDDDSWYCSELAARYLEIAGVFSHRLSTPDNQITPSDLLLLLSSMTDVGEPI